MDEELQFHLALRTEELEQRGLSPADARREALRQFGDVEATRRVLVRAGRRSEKKARVLGAFESLLRDVKYTLRALYKSPGHTLGATLVLAFGMASTVIVFSILDTLVLRPLPLREPDRLFRIGTEPPPDAQWTMEWVALPLVDEWRAHTRSFEDVAGFVDRQFTWQGPNGPERVAGAAVVGDLLSLLGATMTTGRPFTAAEEERTAAVLSHTFWRQRFGARPNVVGETIELDGIDYTVVGVLPPETDLPALGAQRLVWIPSSPTGPGRDGVFANVIGRLHPGVEREAATAELMAILRSYEEALGVTPRSGGVVLQSMQENRTALVGPTLAALFGGSLALLIIACANVATLSLARLVERRHDMAVRCSLGASGWSLARQVIMEHVVLWSIGGGAGMLLAAAGLRWILRAEPLPPTQVPAADAIAIDARVATFAAATTLVTALLFGLLAAAQSAGMTPVRALREDGTTASSSSRTNRWRRLLVAGQVALSTVLASGACLLGLSFANLTSQSLGFRPANLLTFRVQLPERDYPDHASRLQFQRTLVTSLQALAGVEAAATTSALPLGPIRVGPIAVDAPDWDARGAPPWAGVQAVDRNYLATAGVPIVGGRGFDAGAQAGGQPVAIVNETFAQTYFRGRDAIGRRVALGAEAGMPRPWLQIVGIAKDVKHAGLDFDYLPELYVPYDQIPDSSLGGLLEADMFAVVRAASGMMPTPVELQGVVSAIDPRLPLMEMQTGDQIVAASAKPARFRATIMSGVAALAVLVTGMGLFAVLRETVAQRRKEFAIRMALGATPAALLHLVYRSGVGMAAAGIAAGVIATLVLAGALRSLLFGVGLIEPVVLLSVIVAMLVVAAAAAALPAWRTSKLSPTLAIRSHVA